MTEAELLDALIDATRRTTGGEGMTVSEISAATGVNEARIRATIRKAMTQGRVVTCTKVIQTISGRLSPVPSYKFAEPRPA